jgi:hypothetical protein
MSVDARHLAEAFIKTASVNHYLVQVMPGYSEDELNEAEQILIGLDNDQGNENPVLSLALDLIEFERKAMRYRATRRRQHIPNEGIPT